MTTHNIFMYEKLQQNIDAARLKLSEVTDEDIKTEIENDLKLLLAAKKNVTDNMNPK